MAMIPLKFKDVNGNIQTTMIDSSYGIHVELPSTETEWSVTATDPEGEETVDFVGRAVKK